MMMPMMIRPDEVTRSGIIQPYNVVTQSPVTAARHEIDPFIRAIRPQGSLVLQDQQLQGPFGFGIVSPEVLRTLGALGQEDAVPPEMTELLRLQQAAAAIEEERKKIGRQRWYWAAGAAVLGIGAGLLIGKLT
ncbi:hypothetical protein LCGC14_3021540 [marine sediment metagenome]|uniref:Uncharacterized protein n=1 Tax=marine sediment metagenome TaxID=412755 RepID=A0A0F8ZLA3_9ZZZZ